MRLRHIPGSEEEILKSPFVLGGPDSATGDWRELFGNRNSLEVEVGAGKGRFIMEMAMRHPDVNFIGVERYASVLLRAVQRMSELEPDNLRFLSADARGLCEFFEQGEVDRIYLNFSDPWPKERHAKRRLTSPAFLDIYQRILKTKGSLEFKTDNRGLFDYSMERIPACGWSVIGYTYDLHHSDMAHDNVMTEYEMKFSSEGSPICKLIARPPVRESE